MGNLSYPFLDFSQNRVFPKAHTGDVLIWDIDKTYLDTHFSSVRGLLSIPLESALDKHSLPGSVALLRALRRGGRSENQFVPLYFVSGSPKAMRGILERKMLLDGVDFDGIALKNYIALLRAVRPRALVRQVGYKLIALLNYRLLIPGSNHWILFGDNAEKDAEVFEVFADICAGQENASLEQTLRRFHVHEVERREVIRLASLLRQSQQETSFQILIHLASQRKTISPPSGRVTMTHSFLQTALLLASQERIRPTDIRSVLQDIRRRGIPESKVQFWLEDAVGRLGISSSWLEWAQ